MFFISHRSICVAYYGKMQDPYRHRYTSSFSRFLFDLENMGTEGLYFPPIHRLEYVFLMKIFIGELRVCIVCKPYQTIPENNTNRTAKKALKRGLEGGLVQAHLIKSQRCTIHSNWNLSLFEFPLGPSKGFFFLLSSTQVHITHLRLSLEK